MREVPTTPEGVLREFVEDIEQVYGTWAVKTGEPHPRPAVEQIVAEMRRDWYDLAVTYEHARLVLDKIDKEKTT